MSETDAIQDLDLTIRHFVYRQFVREAGPPSIIETAQAFDLTGEQVKDVYERLHENHFLFLDHGTTNIRMANPFSAIPTKFKVRVNHKSYWANCAWDMLGIPAALQDDAVIEAVFEDTREPVAITVADGQVRHEGGVVHFPLPVRQWYDDLILT
jgi:hypothetical protein